MPVRPEFFLKYLMEAVFSGAAALLANPFKPTLALRVMDRLQELAERLHATVRVETVQEVDMGLKETLKGMGIKIKKNRSKGPATIQEIEYDLCIEVKIGFPYGALKKAYKRSALALPHIASFIGTSDCTPSMCHRQLYAQLKAELLAGERCWFSKERGTRDPAKQCPVLQARARGGSVSPLLPLRR